MKRARTLVLLGLATVATATVFVSPVEATTGAASSSAYTRAAATVAKTGTIRYAWLKGCPASDDYTVPCGPWRLTLTNGKTIKLTGATVHPRGANGKVDKESSAPLAISQDGGRIIYVRKSDRKLVWRDIGGKAHSLPGKTARVPKGLGMMDVDPALSPDGDIAVIDYGDERAKMPTLIAHLTSGQIAKLPGDEVVQGFSPDGRRILATRYTDDNTTELVVYDTDGNQTESREVPQVVSNNSPIALADDGVTVGFIITPASGKPRLRLYDLSTDAVSPAVDVPLPAGENSLRMAWDNAGKLTLWHLKSNADGLITRVTTSEVDPSTGALKKLDSVKVPATLWNWWLPGD